MKKFLAITPYFGGTSSAPRQTELNNVLRYFEYTYSSLKPYMTKLIVSVYNDEDYETIRPFSLSIIKLFTFSLLYSSVISL